MTDDTRHGPTRQTRAWSEFAELGRAELLTELAAMQQLQDVSTRLVGAEDVGVLYEQILDAAVAIMRADFASIQLLEPARGSAGELRLLGYRGFTPEAAAFWEWVRPVSESTCGAALRTRERVIVPDVETCVWMAGSEDLTTCRRTGIRAVQTTPILGRGGAILGMLSTHWREPHEPSARDLRLLDVLARQIADLIERARTEAALRASEEKYRTLFEMMGQGYAECELIRDDDGRAIDYRFLEVNPAFERLTGIPAADARGRTNGEVLPGIQDWWVDTYERIVRAGVPERIEYEAAPLGRWYEAHAYPRGGDRFVCLYEEITDRKRAEQVLRESEARQAFLLGLSDALRAWPDEQSIQDQTVKLLAEHLHLDRCWISEVFERQGISTVGPEHLLPALPPMSGVFRLSDFPETMRQLATQPMVIQDSASDPRFSDSERELLAGLHLRALLVVPLRKGQGHVIWSLAAAMDTPRHWTDGERVLLENVAERTWAAVERARAEAALRKSEERLQQAASATGSGVFDWTMATDRLTVNAQFREMFDLAPDEEVTVATLMGAVVHPDDHAPVRARIAEAVDPRSSGHYAVEHRALTSKGLRRMHASGQVHFAGQGADRHAVRLVGIILDVTETRRREGNLAFLAEVSLDLTRIADIDDLMNTLSARIAEHFHLSRCLFAEFDGATGEIAVTHQWHQPGIADADCVNGVPEVLGADYMAALRAGHTIIIRDAQSAPDANAEAAERREVGSRIAVPLLEDERLRFAIVVADTVPRDWRDDEIEVIRELTIRLWTRMERDRVETALRAATSVAEGANRAKSDFLATMSHELRTPLNAIAGHTQILEMGLHGEVNAAQRETLRRIQKNEQHLLSLVNDILNFAKLEAGRVEYDVEDVPLADAVVDAFAVMEPQLTAKSIVHAVAIEPDVTARVDREKLGQILLNLFSNAVKFTDAGGQVTVDIGERAGSASGFIFLRVSDTGIGISREKEDAVFDPFVQVHRRLARTIEGTGLGLAISRDLARGMGGDLRVRSRVDKGSTFTLTLPGVNVEGGE